MRSMSCRRIHTYILHEILLPTLLSLGVFTFLLVMGEFPDLTELVINQRVSAASIFTLFSFQLPALLAVALPLAFLLGVLLAFGRLSSDHEFTALKATGTSLFALLKPVLLLALVFSLVTAVMEHYGKPAGKAAFRDQAFVIASTHAGVGVKAGVFNDSFDGLILYVTDKNEKTGQMSNVFITDLRSAKEPTTIFARKGFFIANDAEKSLALRLYEGSIHSLSRDTKQTYQLAHFETYDLNLNAEQARQDLAERSRSLSEYTSFELLAESRRISDPARLKQLYSDLHRRNSKSFAPFFFALIGIPLGLQVSRSGKGSGFTLALCTALCYYLLLKIAANLVKENLLPVGVAFYLPNLVFLAGGSYAIYRSAIEKPLRLRLPACCRWWGRPK